MAPTIQSPTHLRQVHEAALSPAETRIRQLLRDIDIDTGDVVLFNRKCTSMGVYGGAICACAKFFGQTQWDHNGVVLRAPMLAPDAKTRDDEVFLLEATLTGVKLRPLVARILRSRGHEIAVRKLQVPRTPEFQQKAEMFAFRSLDALYEDNPANFFNAGVSVPTRIARERIFAALMATKKELGRLDAELAHRDQMAEFEKNALQQEQQVVHGRYHMLASELQRRERSVFENAVVEGDSPKMFCSQLVAELYQQVGLLLPYPSAKSYLPKHFSDGNNYLNLQHGASFLPEISIRKNLQHESEQYAIRRQEALDRGPQVGNETATIINCLRRHQLFHSLSESELLATASHFRRRVLTPGENVFYQGATGDNFYIIESGHCNVYIDYNHPSQICSKPTQWNTNKAPPPATILPNQVQKRTTIALPEFQSSSSLVGQHEHVHVATNGPGNAFGDSALMYDTPRRATIQASSTDHNIVLWQLEKSLFRKLVAQYPESQHSLEERRFLLATLSNHPLFTHLDDRAKALAVRQCFPLYVRRGTTILHQGDPGDYFYVIEDGKCEISRMNPRTLTPCIDRVIGRSATFGEAALLYNSRRGASVKALENGKLWCMDRASFVNITKSGSSALYKLFQRIGCTIQGRLTETFVTKSDLQRILQSSQQKSVNSRTCQEKDSKIVEHNILVSTRKSTRAVKLALLVLFHDPSGLVNFSQLAHFHIALGALNIDHFLPEVAFRVLKSYISFDREYSHVSTTVRKRTDVDEATIKLYDLPAAIHQYIATSEPIETNKLSKRVSMTQGHVEFYTRLFDLPAHQQDITHDDLVRGIAAFEAKTSFSHCLEDSDDFVAAKNEFQTFVTILKSDINALRTLWQAAELQVYDKESRSFRQDELKPLLNTSRVLQWGLALCENPTGHDWEALQPKLEGTIRNTKSVAFGQLQYTSLLAALSVGILVRTVCAPLERLKILMQVSPEARMTSSLSIDLKRMDLPYKSVIRGFQNMIQQSGYKSLFSGNLVHCLWVVPFVLGNGFLRHSCQQYYWSRTDLDSHKSQFVANVAIGGVAGVALSAILYPLDVIRGRLTVEQYYTGNRAMSGIFKCARFIWDKESIRGFYRGLGPASLGLCTYIGWNVTLYECMRPVFVHYDVDDTSTHLGHPSVPGQILCATTASLVSQCFSYPFDVIRRRVQLQGANWHPELVFPSYRNAWHCVRTSVAEEGGGIRGVRSLYRGLVVNAMKALPATVISFLSYEKLLKSKQDNDNAR
ncbi:hypothetical protein CCR75_005853 [Bremia lactucae]|uniref:Cyclic nucleotide-binding domain-containing protein n=1 Tax=Bremia lactucae TaxID=4779 RepID=A0A976FG53_BRELC|nr:hypothetical protein CCR75_005853 [Bremia lactucae]